MISVQKADGTTQPFDKEKVRRSLERAKVTKDAQDQALIALEQTLYDGITTLEIYQNLSEILRKSKHPYCSSRYSLKQSLMLFGPTGYPFEDFVAQVLSVDGYTTEVRQQLTGKCVTHEIDVIATKGGKTSMIEAKFHNNAGARSEVQVALYTKARFDDLKAKHDITNAWIVTNTKVTQDALAYAQCENLQVLSWSQPDGESLRDLIERYNLHPITMLATLTPQQKAQLLQNHIVLCKEICVNHTLLKKLSLSKEEEKEALEEIEFICKEEESVK